MKIVVSGYYGFGNAGDEALLQALLSDMRRLRPGARFIVLSGNPADTAARYEVEAIARTNVAAIVRSLRGARLFVSGGGSLLQDATSFRTVPYYAGLMSLARTMGVPVFVYAQGLGPLRRPALRRRAGRALRAAAQVTVRDAASAREALALGVDGGNMHVTADPVFSLAATEREADIQGNVGGLSGLELSTVGQQLLSALPSEPLIGVSLRPLQGGNATAAPRSQQFTDTIAARLAELLPRFGARMVPLPLYPAQDGPLLQRLSASLGPTAVAWADDVAPNDLNAADWIALIGRLQLCITMRLHGLIFAAAAGVPFVALADDPKVDAHVAELGVDPQLSLIAASTLAGAETSPVVADDALATLLERAWHGRRHSRARLREALPALTLRARESAARAIAVAEQVVFVPEVTPSRAPSGRSAGPISEPGSRRTSVLGTPIDAVTMAQTVAAARRFVAARRPAHIVTANPELVMRARRDDAVRGMLAEADLVVADGIGIVGAASILGAPVPERVPGIELMQALLTEGVNHSWRVYLLGGAPGVAQRAAEQIERNWPGVVVVGARDGYFDTDEELAVARDIIGTAPDIVFVGMGAPRQELFIARQREGLSEDIQARDSQWNIPVAIGVGGSIDVLAGRVRRAPAVWQKLGLEWLYRLLREPSRVGRALVLPRFALLVLLHAARRNLL